jgi:hypothetical protein
MRNCSEWPREMETVKEIEDAFKWQNIQKNTRAICRIKIDDFQMTCYHNSNGMSQYEREVTNIKQWRTCANFKLISGIGEL